LFFVLFREVCANFVSFFVSFLTGCGDSAYLLPRFNLLQPCDSTAVGVCFSAGSLLSPDANRTSIRSLLVAVAASGMLNRAVEDHTWRTRGVGPSARHKRENRKSFVDVVTSRHKPEPHVFLTNFRLSGVSGPLLAATALSTGPCLMD
jgi:hypothetical protein